jgi:hypothetical protein
MDYMTMESVSYSVEFDNPTTGGSQPIVTALLANACPNAVGRVVTRAKIDDETSTVYIDFTGSATMAEGKYTDTLSLTLNKD